MGEGREVPPGGIKVPLHKGEIAAENTEEVEKAAYEKIMDHIGSKYPENKRIADTLRAIKETDKNAFLELEIALGRQGEMIAHFKTVDSEHAGRIVELLNEWQKEPLLEDEEKKKRRKEIAEELIEILQS